MRPINRIKPVMEYIKNDFADSGRDNFIVYLITREIIPEEFTHDNDISYGERIDNEVLDTVEKTWLDHPDYRFTQILIQCGIVPNIPGRWFYKEEFELFDYHDFKRIIPRWKTYGSLGRDEPQIISVSEMTKGHMERLLDLPFISDDIRELIKDEIEFRKW